MKTRLAHAWHHLRISLRTLLHGAPQPVKWERAKVANHIYAAFDAADAAMNGKDWVAISGLDEDERRLVASIVEALASAEDVDAPEAPIPASTDVSADTFKTKLTRNIQSRVAVQLGLSRGHICLVANGNRKSARVERALAAEYERVAGEAAKFQRRSSERSA